jgi:hypothetical protein
MKQTCRRCVLHTEMPGITLDTEGICPVCRKYDSLKDHEPRLKQYLTEELEHLFESLKKKRLAYDVIVLFSGGKDSTILLKMVKEKYNLRPLAFAVMHPLVNEVASQNMDRVAEALNIDLIKYSVDREVYRKVMGHGIRHAPEYGLGEFFGCDICSFFHSWIPVKYAIKLGIPVILEGSDSSQTGEISYGQGGKVQSDVSKGIKPFGRVHDLVIDALGDSYRGSIYDFDGEEIEKGGYPSIISPFTFLPYDFRENFRELDDIGLESKKFRSIYTNCSATPFFSYFSIKRYDCVSYIKHYATEVRNGYPNLMQLSIEGEERSTGLNKELVELMMEEYKNVVLYVVENRLTPETVDEAGKEAMRRLAPNYIRVFGQDVCDVLLDDVLRIPHHAEYFGVDLENIGG